ncbi:MAG TPA: ATP-binding protein [Ktedonobacteraceae bacterium]|nr:ATP-binding protein [Ktedonobacteraceae bacterium]
MESHPTVILLIEDDEEDYILLQRVVAKIPNAQYTLLWEKTYASGLAHMLEGHHDLCLLDYRLGAHNGIELTKDARRRGYAGPIIVLTGLNEGEIDIQALQAGADDYIAKDQLQSILLHRIMRYAIERKKAEHERERLLSEQIASRELAKRRNEFISMVVHELKTPLTSLKAYAQLQRRRFARVGDEQTVQLATRMEAQINKLTDLINDFQDVTRIEGGRLQFRESLFSFDGLVTEIVEDLQLSTQHQTFVCEGITNQEIWGDRMRIGQVITNFLTNAMKYAPNTERVILKSYVDTDTLTFSVQDFGPGIPPELQAKIFEPFYRIEDSEQRSAPGLGLGLYIAAEIIQRHGGRIWVESTEGHGATFFFSLPLARDQNTPPQESDR